MLLITCFQTCCENMILSARYRSIHWQFRWFACLLCDIRGPDRDYVTENQQVSTCRHLLSYECVGLTLIDAQKLCREKSHIAFQSGRNNICVRPRHRIKDEPHFCIPPGHNYFHVLNGNTPWHIIVPSGVSKGNNQRENCHIIIMRSIGLGCNNSICAILHGNIQVKAELCWGCKSWLNHLIEKCTLRPWNGHKIHGGGTGRSHAYNKSEDLCCCAMPPSKAAKYEEGRETAVPLYLAGPLWTDMHAC